MRPQRRKSTRCRPEERGRRIALLVISILAPLADAGLAATFGLLGRGAPGLGGWRQTVAALLAVGRTRERRGRWCAVLLARRLESRGAAHRRRCGCSRHSIRSSGNAAGSSISGAGTTGSRPTPSRSSAGSAITRCRCCGATTSSAGPMSASSAGGWRRSSASSATRPRDHEFRRALDAELTAMESFLT